MNHCIVCGRHVARGRTGSANPDYLRCLVCIQARVLRSLVYETPAMKRWRRKQDETNHALPAR